MKIKIDKEIIKKAIYCEYDSRCLSGEKRRLCEVQELFGYNMLEIKPKLAIDCRYHVSIGDTSLCLCPTRYEIYKRYSM